MKATWMVAAVLAGCAGCGGLDRDPAPSGPALQCDALKPSGVASCDLVAPEAVVLARIAPLPGEDSGANGFHVASDGAFLYYVSESRVFRLAVGGGEPEALTASGSAGGSFGLADGWLYWTKDRVVSRMPAEGGDVETLLELPEEVGWSVVPDAILWWRYAGEAEPLRRFRISTGETTDLWSSPADQGIRGAATDGEHVYMALTTDLVRIPLEGGATEVLSAYGGALGPTPQVVRGILELTNEHVYFAGSGPGPQPDGSEGHGPRILRATKAAPHTVDSAADGFAARMAIHAGALFADLAVPVSGEEAHGAIVRVAPDGTVEPIADSDLTVGAAVISWASDGLVASDCWVYFNLRCGEDSSHRLVAMPNPASTR
ncbi:MAG: hypothetical protein WKG00_27895 [Polyangiaceae bacterium]